jgi:hypothetical protein
MRRSRLHLICDIIQQYYTNHTFYNNFGGGPLLNDGKEGIMLEKKVNNLYQEMVNDNNILLFEDKMYKINNDNKTISLLIIRDIYDVIISRTYKNNEWSKIDDIFIDTYKKLLREALNIDNNIKNKMVINTDKFIQDSTYANDLLYNLNIKNYTYSCEVKRMEGDGDGKTFHDEKMRNDVIIPSNIIAMIEKDTEFIDLVYKYYGYDILKKIKS